MLRHLRIENFKAWKDTGEIELAPISVFLGTNSSGKSSIMQFLMMLKQTVQDPDSAVVLNPGDEKSIVDVGLPSHMLYHHDTSKPLKFSYDWDIDAPFRFHQKDVLPWKETLDAIAEREGSVYHIGTSARFYCTAFLNCPGASASWRIANMMYQISHKESLWFSIHTEESITNKYVGEFGGFPPILPQIKHELNPLKFYYVSSYETLTELERNKLTTVNSMQPGLYSHMYYLGPLRDRTSRIYAWKGSGPSDVGIDGRNAVFALLSARSELRKFLLPGENLECDIDTAVAKMLIKMGLIEQFQVKKISSELPTYQVQVKTKGSPVWADLPDVGCGVSQVLPVLVELFYAPPGSILLMEQPELHLHPSAQAALADVMIDAVQARENGKPRAIQLLIETHSEHFLRRLQRRIAEERIDENTVRGYFADTSTDPFQLRKLEIDAYGNISNWPLDFFGDMAGDIFDQAEAAFRRRRDEYGNPSKNH